MGTQGAVTGPDFGKGISISSVPENGMLQGQVDGESVLLIRRADGFYAVGASCPHYGAPLAEGKVVGTELRCPWHHASFDLGTGASTAPSLHPLPCWSVELVGDQLFVRGKKTSARKAKGPADVRRIVVIGAGAAGNAAAETLRAKGYDGKLTVLSADASVPYDKPNLSKDYLAGRAPEEWIPLRSEAFYQEAAIDLRLGTRAVSLDPVKRIVTTSAGDQLAFDRCLLAMGSTLRRINVPGSDMEHVHYLRTLDDCRKIIGGAERAKKAVIVGSGFIGLEVAASLRARGIGVSVVSRDAVPLQRVVGPEVGRLLQRTHEEKGVRFYLDRQIERIEAQAVVLGGGERVPADLVVVGIGVVADVQLAEASGLRLGGGGIAVDSYLETSAPGVYAAGDLACWLDARTRSNMRVEHWVVAGRQGQTAAANMLGERTAFRAVPFFWTVQYDTAIAYIGHAPTWDEIRVSGNIQNRDATVGYLKGGVVQAVVTLGRDSINLEAEAALERNDNERLLALVK